MKAMNQSELQTNGTSEPGAAAPLAPSGEALKNVLESLIFVSEGPVTAKRLAHAARATLAEVQPVLDEVWALVISVGTAASQCAEITSSARGRPSARGSS